MFWLGVFLVAIIVVLGGLLGGMGFFGDPSDTDQNRQGGGNNFIDWML